jgi:hypothetical protein
MQYLALIYTRESEDQKRSEADTQAMMQDYYAFNAAAQEAGVFVAGDALQGTHTATTVRIRDGERMITDGPFAETKEQLGGILILEADSLAHAVELMSKHPGVKNGPFEIRPAVSLDQMIAESEKRRSRR